VEITPRVVVIGAGMAGVLCAVKLLEAGYDDVAVYEKGDRVGGTWRENTYPGIACDVPSVLYSYSFAPNPEWSRTFSAGPEIRDYLENVAREHDVLPLIRFNTEVTRLEFADGRWRVELSDGTEDHADAVLAATGVLHHPNIPHFDGIETFAGAWFHSARWDHSVPLAGRRVGVIGTGSSAVQIVSRLAGEVGELVLFQRTAQWVLPVENPPISDEDHDRFRADKSTMLELQAQLSAIFTDAVADIVITQDSPRLTAVQEMCEANLAKVADPELRERLRPNYRAACKRLVISPNFYEAMQHPATRLVTAGIERVEPEGVRTADGELHELDVLVLATGFRVDRFLRPIDVIGRDGVKLSDVWAERPTAYLSVSIPGVPNLFMLNGPNGPVGNFSLITVAEMQFAYIRQLLDLLSSRRAREISATQEATDRHEADRVEAAKNTIWVTGCKSWYLDDRGVPSAWPWTWGRFVEVMEAPILDDYDVVT
jgi:cation diffusion facilitator CzcD-associated flavoprotein CzcO